MIVNKYQNGNGGGGQSSGGTADYAYSAQTANYAESSDNTNLLLAQNEEPQAQDLDLVTFNQSATEWSEGEPVPEGVSRFAKRSNLDGAVRDGESGVYYLTVDAAEAVANGLIELSEDYLVVDFGNVPNEEGAPNTVVMYAYQDDGTGDYLVNFKANPDSDYEEEISWHDYQSDNDSTYDGSVYGTSYIWHYQFDNNSMAHKFWVTLHDGEEDVDNIVDGVITVHNAGRFGPHTYNEEDGTWNRVATDKEVKASEAKMTHYVDTSIGNITNVYSADKAAELFPVDGTPEDDGVVYAGSDGLYQHFAQDGGWSYTVSGDGAEISRSGGTITSIALSKSADTLTVKKEVSYPTELPFSIITPDGSECAVHFYFAENRVYIYTADMSGYITTISYGNTWTSITFYGLSIRCKWYNNQFKVQLKADADAAVWPEGALMFGYGYGSDNYSEYKPEKVDQFATKAYVDEATAGGSYTLPVASQSTLGGIKVGNGLSIENDGTLSASGGIDSGAVQTQIDESISANNQSIISGTIVAGEADKAKVLKGVSSLPSNPEFGDVVSLAESTYVSFGEWGNSDTYQYQYDFEFDPREYGEDMQGMECTILQFAGWDEDAETDTNNTLTIYYDDNDGWTLKYEDGIQKNDESFPLLAMSDPEASETSHNIMVNVGDSEVSRVEININYSEYTDSYSISVSAMPDEGSEPVPYDYTFNDSLSSSSVSVKQYDGSNWNPLGGGSVPSNVVTGVGITAIAKVTQSEYAQLELDDELDPTTFYIVVADPQA